MSEDKTKFLLSGIVTSAEFQRCRYYIEALHRSFPKFYDEPDIRPMLNVDWNIYITKLKRKIGQKVWELQKSAVVFINGIYLGDDMDLLNFMMTRVRINVKKDFYKMGVKHLKEIINKTMELGRKFAYLQISIDSHCIGTMLFMLYNDYVPKTSECFLRRCRKRHRGWRNRNIHRIAQNSWIQGGNFDLRHRRMACENYIVPHDKRGVLSTCNIEKHKNNSTQFMVSLNPTPWMDYKFVAFGQLVQGDEVLKLIEETPTYYESPKKEILIKNCGEFKLEDDVDAKTLKYLENFLIRVDEITGERKDITHPDDASSEMSLHRYKKGLYCLETDMESHLPFTFLPDYLFRLCQEDIAEDDVRLSEHIPPIITSKMSQTDVSFAMSNHHNKFMQQRTKTGLTDIEEINLDVDKEFVTNVVIYNESRNLKPYIEPDMDVNDYKPLYL